MCKKSQVLIISLWILVILTILAISISHRVSMALYLSKYQRDRLKAIYLAKAGVNRAIIELEKDKNANTYDSLNETWSTGCDAAGKSLFENVEIEAGAGETFTVKYLYHKENNEYLCMADEERKINLNKLDDFGKKQLAALFLFAGLGEAERAELENIILAWIDPGPETEAGREIFKNGPLKTPEELLLILEYFYELKAGLGRASERAQEVYSKIKDLITVYGDGRININTVSGEVLNNILLRALFNVLPTGSISIDQINDISRRIVLFRNGGGVFDTPDIENKLGSGLTIEQHNAIVELNNHITIKSDNFRIESVGNAGRIRKEIITIVERADPIKIVYWHED